MVKKLYTAAFALAAGLVLAACGGGDKKPKALTVPVAHAVADTVLTLGHYGRLRVHVDFAYLRGKEYAAVNDSLLRMGLLQPDYSGISYQRLQPVPAVRDFVRRYADDYVEMARLIRQHEKKAARLDWQLDIRTRFAAGQGSDIVCLADIANKTGDAVVRYTLVRNFNPKTGRITTLADAFGDDYRESLTHEIVSALAGRLGLENADSTALRTKGYFVGTSPYPTDNCILTDDSATFIYTPGEIAAKEVRVSIER
ncbi:RsiV family protein [Prevotella dentasini]|uniref:RsiV family protein n=1 Tax=Prevotella dentasini TaxID=589537 RepID=UPI00046A7447|nr:RsiV family protein [Prevotella dentasini]